MARAHKYVLMGSLPKTVVTCSIVVMTIVYIARLYIALRQEDQKRNTIHTLTTFGKIRGVSDHLTNGARMGFNEFQGKLENKYHNTDNTPISKQRGSAICFMTTDFSQATYDTAKTIAKEQSKQDDLSITVFYIVDLVESFEVWETEDRVNMVGLNQSISKEGFVGADAVYNLFKSTEIIDKSRKVIAWEKALYCFIKLKKYFHLVWFVEGDVHIPSLEAFKNLHFKSIAQKADLVIPSNTENKEGKWKSVVKNKHGKSVVRNDWQWHFLKDSILPPPWYGSMACAVGMSTKMLDKLDEYRVKRGRFEFIEVFFNTLAMHERLNVFVPGELGTIHYRVNWTCEHIRSTPLNWFHPVKDTARHRNCTSFLAAG